MRAMAGLQWDLFCRVIDNHGDLGVCWRLAADLAKRGETVRLWTDDASALVWMAPSGVSGVSVHRWQDATGAAGDVVVEAFGCDPPARFVQRMAAGRQPPPLWLNLEYLSAEDYVRRSHGLPSPQLAGPGVGLTKWFYYPGFVAGTGGLLRESDLWSRRQGFDAEAWLPSLGAVAQEGEQCVSLFCYDNPAMPDLLDAFARARTPTLLLCTPGPAWTQVDALLGPSHRRGALRAWPLPLLTQVDYDHLLWSCDLNFVRGEDSFVRAQWAGVPFVWQAYRQPEGRHAVKVQAFLDAFLDSLLLSVLDSSSAAAAPSLAQPLRRIHARWNGLGGAGWQWPEPAAWRSHAASWRDTLLAQDDLSTQMLRFVEERR